MFKNLEGILNKLINKKIKQVVEFKRNYCLVPIVKVLFDIVQGFKKWMLP